MKKRHLQTAALSLLLTASLLSGCGQKATTETQNQTAAETTALETTADETTAAETDAASPTESIYASADNWAYLGTDEEGRADVFFICPSVYGGSEDAYNMSLSDEDTKYSFQGAINMEKGIYDEDTRFFAPYYRQIGLNVYEMPAEEREPYLEIAYDDVKDAFDYYCDTWNDGQPIILAGFSQGADMCIRLMKDCFDDEALMDQLVACYAIGWSVTEDEVSEFPQLKMAQGGGRHRRDRKLQQRIRGHHRFPNDPGGCQNLRH